MFATGRAVPAAVSFLLVAGSAATTQSPPKPTRALLGPWEGLCMAGAVCGQGWVDEPCLTPMRQAGWVPHAGWVLCSPSPPGAGGSVGGGWLRVKPTHNLSLRATEVQVEHLGAVVGRHLQLLKGLLEQDGLAEPGLGGGDGEALVDVDGEGAILPLPRAGWGRGEG